MAATKKGKAAPPAAEKHVGTVEHYYPKVKAAAVHLDAGLKVGDTIHIKGATDDYTEKVTSLQMDHKPIAHGKAGESIGVRVPVKVHQHSEVLKVQASAAPAAAHAKPKAAKKVSKPKKAKSAARRPAKKAKRSKKASRKAPKGGKKGTAGKRSKGSNKRKATKARKAARATSRKGKRRAR